MPKIIQDSIKPLVCFTLCRDSKVPRSTDGKNPAHLKQLISSDLRAVDVRDGVEQVVSLVDDDDGVLQPDAERVTRRLVKQRVVRNDDNLFDQRDENLKVFFKVIGIFIETNMHEFIFEE